MCTILLYGMSCKQKQNVIDYIRQKKNLRAGGSLSEPGLFTVQRSDDQHEPLGVSINNVDRILRIFGPPPLLTSLLRTLV